MKLLNLFTLITAIALVVSCGKPTAESEMKYWESNLKKVDALGAKYSGFKQAIDIQLTQAKGLWEKAVNIEGEEAKAEAMRGANRTLYGGWVRNLDNMQDRLEGLKDKVSDSRQTKEATPTDIASLNEAVSEAKITMSQVERMLSSSSATTIAQAEGLVNNATKQLDAASKRLDRAVKNIKDRIDEKKEQNEKEKTEEEEQNQAVKCAACGQMNDPGTTKCAHCTAPISAK